MGVESGHHSQQLANRAEGRRKPSAEDELDKALSQTHTEKNKEIQSYTTDTME